MTEVVLQPELFRPEHDADGKRLRSLDLYGLDAAFRSTDRFKHNLRQIVACAALFGGASSADVLLWSRSGPEALARSGPRLTPELRAEVERLWTAVGTGADFLAAEGDDAGDQQVVSAPIVGREGAVLGLLVVCRDARRRSRPEERWLVEQLARAAVAALDEQRRTWERRRTGTDAPVELVGRQDRRRG